MRNLLLLLPLYGCATISPTIGMGYAEWEDQCRSESWQAPVMIAANEYAQAYKCPSKPSVAYLFADNVLREIVPLPTQPNNGIASYALIDGGLRLMGY